MVNTPSVAAAQANDTESKRRKQTLERARANHLSRQLQMRLQYARLKVDHGWQKQSLNEVENLYFHHSHMRGPRHYPSSTLTTFAQPSLLQPTNTTRPHPTQSSLSFKQHLNGSGRSVVGAENPNGGTVVTSKAAGGGRPEAAGSQSQNIPAVRLPPENDSSPTLIDPTLLPLEDSLISMDVNPDSISSERMPSLVDDPFIAGSNTTLTMTAITTTKPKSKPTSKSKSKSNRSPHSPSQGVSILANNANANSAISLPANPHSTAVAHSNNQSNSNINTAYEFGNSVLTYDSFWSSHSTANTSTGPGSVSTSVTKSYRNVFGVGTGEVELGGPNGGE